MGRRLGWLRELMEVSDPEIDGYGELARRALAHSEWPADTQPRERSLAALFSKLDRGIELEWLADRDAVQRVLALVLGCPVESVRRAVAPDPAELGIARIRFEDLPYARPFDLRSEPLPPGIPEPVLAPAAWNRLWWVAPSGSGRSLVGQWLAARGLARFVCGARLEDVRDRLASSSPLPLFLELERGANPDESFGALLGKAVCVAAPVAPAPVLRSAWQLIESPPLAPLLPALMAWIEARVPQDGAFDVAAAKAWLSGPVATGVLPTLGAVLGAAGVLDARGARAVAQETLPEVAERFVSERLEQATFKGSAEAQWLKRYGFGALVKLAENALTGSLAPWGVSRTQDEWIALVPAELEKSVDSEWVRWSAAREGSPASLRAVERALREAPPGAYRLVRALVDARLLTERAPGRLTVSPQFLAHAALARARDGLVHDASPFAWGEALLRPHAAGGVLEAMYRRIERHDYGAAEQLAELDVPAHASLVAAAEALLVCLGLHAASGAEVPLELLENSVREQLGLLVELPGELPRPRLLHAASGEAPLAEHAVWMLALLAASEPLGERLVRPHSLLCPWRAPPPPEVLAPVLDAIYAALARPELCARPWAVEAFALAGRLLEPPPREDGPDEEPDGTSAPPHPLARPARIADAMVDADLDGHWLRGFGAHPLDLPALQAACASRGVGWPRMAHALWKAWHGRGCPADAELLFAPDGPEHRAMWPHLPSEVLASIWSRWTARESPWPFECFGPSQWSSFIELFGTRWRRTPLNPIWSAAVDAMTLEQVRQAVAGGALLDAREPAARVLVERVGRRFPDWLAATLAERADAGDAGAVEVLLGSARASAGEDALVGTLGESLARRTTQLPVIDVARRFLHEKIRERRGDWRRAYALFVDLEERLARAARARGSPALG